MSIESEEEGSTARSNVAAKGGENPPLTYSRDEMMILREGKLSRTRPDYLGIDFDGDDNMFSPFKWLQYKWEEEGVKDRPMTRKNEMMREEGESTVLSPQRRAFSSGCRAPEDKGTDLEDGKEKGRTWRQGAPKNDYNNKFKADRERNDKRGGTTWRNDRWNDGKTDKDRPNKFERDRKNMGRRDDDRIEKLPEWAADGPTSVNDLIELKGFDEPKKKKERTKQEKKSDSPKNGSRPPSNPSSSAQPPIEETTSLPVQQSFPKSDEEFAKFLGLLDNNDQSGQHSDILNDIMNTGNTEESQAATGSRLSRFFKTRAQNDDTNINTSGHNGQRRGSGENERESILSRIFDHKNASAPKSNDIPKQQSEAPRSGGPMTLEDLERSLKPATDVRPHFGDLHSKPNLQDPREHANLLSKLERMAREQKGWNGGAGMPIPPTHPHPVHSVPPVSGIPPAIAAAMGMNPMMRDPAYVAHCVVQSQYNAAMMQAATVLQGPVPPQIQERIRQAAEANFPAAHQVVTGEMAMAQAVGLSPQAAAAQAMAVAISGAHHHAEAKRPQTTSLIPASVQKKAAVVLEEKKEKLRHEEDTEKADLARRAVMQQQYTNMMSAMQGGLSMNAYRAAAAAPTDGARVNHPNQTHVAAMTLAAQQQKARKAPLMHPQASHDEFTSHSQPMQNPLEKLLAAAGVEPKEVRSNGHAPIMSMHHHIGMANARPISLEELERSLTMK
uniref:Ifet-1 n=1 Tax=Pristionchus pacificus TaxID=54126 RepID=A0A8R1UE15_PRIPA